MGDEWLFTKLKNEPEFSFRFARASFDWLLHPHLAAAERDSNSRWREQDYGFSAVGSEMRNCEPQQATLWASMAPPCMSTIQRAIASPRPEPPGSPGRAR